MLWREYAIEPAAFGLNAHLASQILSLIECSRGTVVAECPSRWLREVYGAIRSWKNSAPIRAAGIEAKLQQIKATALFPSRPKWEGHLPWPDAAMLEHQREPFDVVMSLGERKAEAWLRLPDDLDFLDPRLAATHEILVPRTAEAMAAAMGSLLRASKQIVFVDPHFSPGADRFIRPLYAWFQELQAGRLQPTRLEYHTLWDSGARVNAYRRNLGNKCHFVPADWRLSVVNWRERPGGEKMHARYIITERAAVRFDVGLDDGDTGQNVPITILPYAEHQRWLATFNEQATVFERHGRIFDVFARGEIQER